MEHRNLIPEVNFIIRDLGLNEEDLAKQQVKKDCKEMVDYKTVKDIYIECEYYLGIF